MGAGLAGVRAAASLRERGYSGELTLLGAEREPPYDRPPLSKKVLLADADPVPLDPSWYAGATLVHGRATELAPGVLGTDAGELPWDGLVLATGAEPRRLSGSDGAAAVLRTAADALRLRSSLVPGAHVVIVGAGWIGAEVATAAAKRGCAVTVLEAGTAPLVASLGPVAGERTARWYGEAGVELRTGAAVSGVGSRGVRLAGADLVVEAVGVRPRLDWLAGSGVEVDGASGGVLVDEHARSTLAGVVAAGDCAARWSPRTGRRVRTEHWDDALHAPSVAAASLLDHHRELVRVDAVAALQDEVADHAEGEIEQFGRYLQWVGWRHDDAPALWRGDPAGPEGWSAIWLDGEGRLTGVLAVDRPRDAVQGRRLIDAGAAPDPDRLADPAVPLRSA